MFILSIQGHKSSGDAGEEDREEPGQAGEEDRQDPGAAQLPDQQGQRAGENFQRDRQGLQGRTAEEAEPQSVQEEEGLLTRSIMTQKLNCEDCTKKQQQHCFRPF